MKNKILVVDDSVELCEEITDILTEEGYEVNSVHDGLAGIKLIMENRYDLVLLDLKMPGIDGFCVLKDLRSRGSEIKIIVVTAKPLASDLLETEGGLTKKEYETLKLANSVIAKPYDPGHLMAEIKKQIG